MAQPRAAAIDLLKAAACVAIVWHHLAFYGPMSDAARPLWPAAVDALYTYGRMAVQVFLVVGGYLTAASLAPDGRPLLPAPVGVLLWRRWRRLVLPYAVALAAAMLVAALLRPWFGHASVPPAPTLTQVAAHLLLLHDLLDQEALSAGVWYVAIDFQLYALAVVGLALGSRGRGGGRLLAAGAVAGGVSLLCALSLFWFNRDPRWDETALYFAGAYGFGMLAWLGARAPRPAWAAAALLALGLSALLVDFRGRIAVALATAVLLLWAGRAAAGRLPVPGWVTALAHRSYAVFLIHFPVCLAVGAVVELLWPAAPWPAAAGMLLAFGLSLVAGHLLYESVERRFASPPRRTTSSLEAGVVSRA